MLSAVEAFVLASAPIWIYLLLFRAAFWRPGNGLSGSGPVNGVVAVIPARNEAGLIGRSVRSLAGQGIPVVLADDESIDGTADEARQAHPQITVRQAGPRPPGWTGKMWAVHNGLEAAATLSPRFVLLTDGDIEHGAGSVAELMAIAEEGGYDLVSWMVHLHCQAWYEKLLIPPFVFFFFKLYPPSWIRDRRRSTAGAAGGCMLVRYEALRRIGGVESIRGELIDDCALATRIKQSGGAIWLGITRQAHSLRPYDGSGEVWRMIKRSAFTQLRHSTLLLAGTVLAMLMTYLAPVLLVVSGGWVAWALMTACFAPMVRWYGLPLWWSLTLPVAAMFYLGATAASAVDYWRGRGGYWKGRVQGANSA